MKRFLNVCISIVLIVVLVFSFSGCSAVKTKSAETALKKALDSFIAFDADVIDAILDTGDSLNLGTSAENTLAVIKPLFTNIKYEIISSKLIDDNTVSVKTKITTIDSAPIIDECFTEITKYVQNVYSSGNTITEEEIEQKTVELLEELFSRRYPVMRTTEADAIVIFDGKKWVIDDNDEFIDAIMGGMLTELEKFEDTLEE